MHNFGTIMCTTRVFNFLQKSTFLYLPDCLHAYLLIYTAEKEGESEDPIGRDITKEKQSVPAFSENGKWSNCIVYLTDCLTAYLQ